MPIMMIKYGSSVDPISKLLIFEPKFVLELREFEQGCIPMDSASLSFTG